MNIIMILILIFNWSSKIDNGDFQTSGLIIDSRRRVVIDLEVFVLALNNGTDFPKNIFMLWLCMVCGSTGNITHSELEYRSSAPRYKPVFFLSMTITIKRRCFYVHAAPNIWWLTFGKIHRGIKNTYSV